MAEGIVEKTRKWHSKIKISLSNTKKTQSPAKSTKKWRSDKTRIIRAGLLSQPKNL
jgi:hypothetical protein